MGGIVMTANRTRLNHPLPDLEFVSLLGGVVRTCPYNKFPINTPGRELYRKKVAFRTGQFVRDFFLRRGLKVSKPVGAQRAAYRHGQIVPQLLKGINSDLEGADAKCAASSDQGERTGDTADNP